MKKETDLGGVKAIAKTLLMTAVNQTPYSPIHASAADAAHMRLALLCQKRFPIDFATSLI